MNSPTNSTTNSILAHVSLGVRDIEESVKFYDAVLACLGIYRCHEIPGVAIAYGQGCEFWIGIPLNNESEPTAGNGVHIAFNANSKEAVDNFYRVALEQGGCSYGKPGLRPEYSKTYYAAFIKDRDGNKIEAVFNHDESPIPG